MRTIKMKTGLKCIIPVLSFAALAFAGCKKEETPSLRHKYNCVDVELARRHVEVTNDYNHFKQNLDSLLTVKPVIDTIYLVSDISFSIPHSWLSSVKETLEEFLSKDRNRIRGKGSITFSPGALQGPDDAAWFNARGWDVKVR